MGSKRKSIFMYPKDLMELDDVSYSAACKALQGIRDAIAKNKRKLTIKEYCRYMKLDLVEIWSVLRPGEPSPY